MFTAILLWLGITAASIVVYAGLIYLLAPRQKETGFINWDQL